MMVEHRLDHLSRKRYRKFLIFQSSVSLLLLAASAFYLQMVSSGYVFSLAAAALWLAASHGFLVYSLRVWKTPADGMTLARFGLGIIALIVACAGGAGVLILAVMSMASLGDWIDGRLAALYGATPQGAILDSETDQTLIFILAVLGVTVGGLGVWLLLFPCYRYGYVLLLEIFAIPADNPKPKAGGNFRGRAICAMSQAALLANLLPYLALSVKTSLSVLALAFLIYSFADDLLYQFKERFQHSIHSSRL